MATTPRSYAMRKMHFGSSDNEKKKASTNGMKMIKMHPYRALHEESSVTGLEKKS